MAEQAETKQYRQRYIDLSEYDLLDNPEGNAKAQGWLTANSIDPSSVPSHQFIQIVNDEMEVVFFSVREDGTKEVGSNGYAKSIKWVPVRAYPEEFGI